MSEQRKWTLGPYGASKQRGMPGHCLQAQVWGPDGGNLATIEPTIDPVEATAVAELFSAAPDLYEALRAAARELMAIHRQSGDEANAYAHSNALRLARAALAKADGR